jgi:hypothetical protein
MPSTGCLPGEVVGTRRRGRAAKAASPVRPAYSATRAAGMAAGLGLAQSTVSGHLRPSAGAGLTPMPLRSRRPRQRTCLPRRARARARVAGRRPPSRPPESPARRWRRSTPSRPFAQPSAPGTWAPAFSRRSSPGPPSSSVPSDGSGRNGAPRSIAGTVCAWLAAAAAIGGACWPVSSRPSVIPAPIRATAAAAATSRLGTRQPERWSGSRPLLRMSAPPSTALLSLVRRSPEQAAVFARR